MMTFEEWDGWKDLTLDEIRQPPLVAKVAWEAATRIATRAERERCAGKCDERAEAWLEMEKNAQDANNWASADFLHRRHLEAEECADAIREQEERTGG